jgi:hypothetical protein
MRNQAYCLNRAAFFFTREMFLKKLILPLFTLHWAATPEVNHRTESFSPFRITPLFTTRRTPIKNAALH